MDVRVGLWRRLSAKKLIFLNCGAGGDSWESLGLQGGPTSPFWRRSALGFLRKDWCWSWNSSTLATSCEELTHWRRLWYWEGLEAGGEGDNRGWDGWMASLTRWTWFGNGQGGLACCDSWGRKESDTTERLIWSDMISCECLVTQPSRLLCPWNFPGMNTGWGGGELPVALHRIFSTRRSNSHFWCLLHCQADFFTTSATRGIPHARCQNKMPETLFCLHMTSFLSSVWFS